MRTRQTGFTLVEIAIVLVIIGLLLGGILKGQEMIVQAKIKNAMADISGTSAAYYGYRDRYRAIPGDDVNAGTRWTTPAAADPGNGNGVVEGKYNTETNTDESYNWWDHLRRAGFISGSGAAQPLNAFTGMIGVQTGDGAATPGAALGGLTGLLICSAGLSDKVAIALDSQIDDGMIGTGTVRGQLNSGSNPDIATTVTVSAYVETGTNFYTVCRQI